ncbi:thioredoxin-dependent thiol peroxidase [uncultured Microbacterium sp.]|uniref:thioredoxin-dependent thiol peroxidase n=1 Tax=uncultured Microbacterium sp. TaxID=191216 RepID=UPI0025D4F72A|nr:thioredoxin-dependent thiol peroxidase [uncultured Microbacterium sp.]
MSTRLAPGDLAPDFALDDADGARVALADYRGRNVVVYFYPKAATPGCTTEACDFRDSLSSLAAAGYAVIGISPDSVDEIRAFAEAEGLTFPLLADTDAAVARAWGVWGEKTVEGRTFEGVIRSTFVIDGSGRVERAEYGVDASGHVARLREALGV